MRAEMVDNEDERQWIRYYIAKSGEHDQESNLTLSPPHYYNLFQCFSRSRVRL